MKFNLVRTIELSLLVVLLCASVGAISSVSFSSGAPAPESHADPFGVSAAREWQTRVIEYLNSPTINPK